MTEQAHPQISMESIINNSPIIVISRKVEKDFPVKYVSNNIWQFGYTPEDFYSGEVTYPDLIHPEDRKVVLKSFKYLNKQLSEFVQEYRIMTRFGEIRYIEDRVRIKTYDDKSVYLEGTILDITERKHHEMITDQRNSNDGKPLTEISLGDVLGLLVTNAERVRPGLTCAVMLLDRKKQHICRVIAPNLPSSYKEAMEGLEIGYGVCSGGTALYMGERIIVDNIEEHPYWALYRDVAKKAGIKASWAELITASTGEILGVFIMYFDFPNKPKKACYEYLKANADLAAIEIEHRIVNETFRESEHKFKTIFNNINDQIYVSELNGNLIDVNQVVVDNLGYSKEFIIKSSPLDIVPSWYVQRASELIKVIEKDNKAMYEAAAIRKDGSIIPLEINARMINYNGKKTILSVGRDITERKKAEKAKQLNESRLEALIKLNEMTTASLDEIAEFVKEEAVRLTESKLGYLAFMNADETDLIMHSWSNSAMTECGISDKQFIYPVETTGLWGEAVKQRKAIITNDYSAPSPWKKGYPEGHVKLTRHMNVPIFDGDHIVAVVGVGNKEEEYDETDVRQLTLLMQGMWKIIQSKQLIGSLSKYSEELSKANNKLRSVNMMKEEFLEDSLKKGHDVLHDYDVLDDETLNLLDDSQKEAISSLLMNSERLKLLIDAILYSNKQQSGRMEYSFAPLSIGSVLSDVLLNQILLIDEKELELERDIPTGLPPVKGDKEKLEETFLYLIHNAVTVTPKGNCIGVEVSDEGDNIHISIKDTGKGIEKNLIPRLFYKMYQVDDTISRMYQGLESSLYICKDTVVAHEGDIWIESEVGKGSTFHVTLPKWTDSQN
ncbi:GAF domain-containing protein [Methanolobus zinderi]|jgi:PAS domain S-box-containing protein|uniref:histidine kinase n=1 Tax=Methanolobus zinderi TaxID=536044 RepID=A0A7D5E7T8_9EURY|nr:GAF domain-containing protein [Methanolobus zinderi]QLC49711.1 GAF domain-containing protein [Methanolobus zinderi]